MRIIVCIKQISHVFGRTGRDDAGNYVTGNDVIRCINPFDIAALELALGVKDAGEEVEVILLSLGPLIAESDLRRCLAMGADEIYRIDCGDSLDGWYKSLLLADALKKLEADLVFCGDKSMDSGSGQTGPFIASHLGLPFISRVTDVTVAEIAEAAFPVRVERNRGSGRREIAECGLPAIISAALGPAIPRYPSLENKRRVSRMPIRVLTPERQETAPGIISTRVFPARPRPKPVVAPDSTVPSYQRIEQLLRGSNVEKKGEMVKGTPEQQVERILSFLQERDFLASPEKEA